jgi:hypothetical protein
MRGTATLALALTLASPAARAEPVAASLAWVRGAGAEGCAGAEAVRARVAALLGYDPAALPAPARSVEVTVTRGETWRAALYVRDASGALLGERVLESPDARCDAVVGAVAFAVATALDAEVVRPPEPVPPAAPACPAPAPCPSCPAPEPPRPRRAPRWRVNAEVSAGILVGALPEPALELSMRVSARPPSWPWLYADLGWSPEVTREVAGG